MSFPIGCYPMSQKPLSVPFVGALDGFPPDYAWSHRRALLTNFTGTLLQARRLSDDTHYDVPVKADGEGDFDSLLSFLGGESAAVTQLSEQIGGQHLLQGTADSQRIIVDSGSLVTVGGKAASRGRRHNAPDSGSDGPGGVMVADLPAYTGAAMSIFLRISQGTYGTWFNGIVASILTLAKNTGDSNSAGSFSLYRSTAANAVVTTNYSNLISGAFESDCLISIIFDGSNITFRDGVNTYTASYSVAFDINKLILSGYNSANAGDYSAKALRVQELVIWTSDQTVNEAAIRSAMMA